MELNLKVYVVHATVFPLANSCHIGNMLPYVHDCAVLFSRRDIYIGYCLHILVMQVCAIHSRLGIPLQTQVSSKIELGDASL